MLIELHPKPIELAQLKRKSRYAHVGDIITACGEMWLVRDGFRCQDCDIRRCDIPCRARQLLRQPKERRERHPPNELEIIPY